MIAIGIPSYNEADNISSLVKKIDSASVSLGIPIVIINADNNSPDKTAEKFNNTKTISRKISIITRKIGKGSNVFSIFEEVLKIKSIEYLFLIDADIKSFEADWLKKHHDQCVLGSDYVLPSYKRKYIEGNCTNHFAYPMMKLLLKGDAPQQPIAGDIGLSRRFIDYLVDQEKPRSAYGYGVDMFISAHAVSFEGKMIEIDLDKKIHKPSFHKMKKIFQEEASSYYFVRSLNRPRKSSFISCAKINDFLDSSPISESDFSNRLEEARLLFSQKNLLKQDRNESYEEGIVDLSSWVDILRKHEGMVGVVDNDDIASSLLPFYLLRVVTYLKECDNPVNAKNFITNQAKFIQEKLS